MKVTQDRNGNESKWSLRGSVLLWQCTLTLCLMYVRHSVLWRILSTFFHNHFSLFCEHPRGVHLVRIVSSKLEALLRSRRFPVWAQAPGTRLRWEAGRQLDLDRTAKLSLSEHGLQVRKNRCKPCIASDGYSHHRKISVLSSVCGILLCRNA